MANGESAGAVVIRELLVRAGVVGGDDAKKDLKELEDSFESARGAALKMVGVAGAVVGSLAAVAGSAVALAVSTAQGSSAMLKQAATLKEQTENLQELGFAFDSVGQSSDDMVATLFALNNRAEEAVAGSKALRENFSAVGVSLNDIRKSGPASLFEQLANHVAGAKDQGAAMSRVMKVLGEDVARKVAPLLIQGADGIRSLRQEARELGIVTSGEALVASAELANQWRQLQAVGSALRDEIGLALTPAVKEIVGATLEWIKANRELISLRLEVVVRNAVSLFRDWAPIIAGVSLAFGGLVAAIAGFLALPFIATFALANAPILLLAASIGVIIGAFVTLGLVLEDINVYFAGGESLIGRFIDRLRGSHPFLAETIRFLASFARFNVALIGSIFRFARALGEWSTALALVANEGNPLLRTLRALWKLVNLPLSGSWVGWVADQLSRGAAFLENADFTRPDINTAGEFNSRTTNNNTDNSRADITQNITVSGGDAEETVEAALRAGRQAVGGGRR